MLGVADHAVDEPMSRRPELLVLSTCITRLAGGKDGEERPFA